MSTVLFWIKLSNESIFSPFFRSPYHFAPQRLLRYAVTFGRGSYVSMCSCVCVPFCVPSCCTCRRVLWPEGTAVPKEELWLQSYRMWYFACEQQTREHTVTLHLCLHALPPLRINTDVCCQMLSLLNLVALYRWERILKKRINKYKLASDLTSWF